MSQKALCTALLFQTVIHQLNITGFGIYEVCALLSLFKLFYFATHNTQQCGICMSVLHTGTNYSQDIEPMPTNRLDLP